MSFRSSSSSSPPTTASSTPTSASFNLVNYATAHHSWGWRISLGLAGAPTIVIFVGALFLTDTPSSLVMRGRGDSARAELLRVCGADADVDAELRDIAKAVEAARRSEDGAFRRMATRRAYRPHLVLAVAVPMFFQLTGVIVLAFFSSPPTSASSIPWRRSVLDS